MLAVLRTIIGRAEAVQLAIVGLVATAALLVWLALVKADDIADAARAQAIAERDAHWTAQIEKSNALAARQQAAQAVRVLSIEAAANQRVKDAENQLAEMEKDNAALPNGDDRGLSRARVRLLAR